MSLYILFDYDHLKEGLICAKSFKKHNKGNIYVLCLDDLTFKYVSLIDYIIPIRLENLENKELIEAKNNRPWNSYAVTLKPFLPNYIFEVFNENFLIGVDSDMYFFSEFNENMDCSVLVTSREQIPTPGQGNINGGFIALKNDENTKKFLNWLQNKCLEYCLRELDNGRFCEEGYLRKIDETDMFPYAKVSKNPGINMAWWNVKKHKIDKNFIIDGKYKLICFHYQGMIINKGWYNPRIKIESPIIKSIYDMYYEEIK